MALLSSHNVWMLVCMQELMIIVCMQELLISGGGDRTVKLWGLPRMHCLQHYKEHKAAHTHPWEHAHNELMLYPPDLWLSPTFISGYICTGLPYIHLFWLTLLLIPDHLTTCTHVYIHTYMYVLTFMYSVIFASSSICNDISTHM